MPTLYEYYVRNADGTIRYFRDIREANEFAKSVANATKRPAHRYDIYGGVSYFYPITGVE